MSERNGLRKSATKSTVASLGFFVLLASAGCGNSQELRDIEEGRDNPPAVDASPPEEQN